MLYCKFSFFKVSTKRFLELEIWNLKEKFTRPRKWFYVVTLLKNALTMNLIRLLQGHQLIKISGNNLTRFSLIWEVFLQYLISESTRWMATILANTINQCSPPALANNEPHLIKSVFFRQTNKHSAGFYLSKIKIVGNQYKVHTITLMTFNVSMVICEIMTQQ